MKSWEFSTQVYMIFRPCFYSIRAILFCCMNFTVLSKSNAHLNQIFFLASMEERGKLWKWWYIYCKRFDHNIGSWHFKSPTHLLRTVTRKMIEESYLIVNTGLSCTHIWQEQSSMSMEYYYFYFEKFNHFKHCSVLATKYGNNKAP